MSKSVKKLTKDTVRELNEKLNEGQSRKSKQEVKSIISTSLNNAFLEVAHNEKENLYKSFAREFSAESLDKNDRAMLQKELKNCVPTNFYLQVLTNPINKSNTFYEHLNSFNNPLQNSLQRYPQPLNALTNFFTDILSFTLKAAVTIFAFPIYSVDFIISRANLIEEKLINLFTQNSYRSLIIENSFTNNVQAKRDFYDAQRIRYRATHPATTAEFDALSDYELRDKLIASETVAKFNAMQENQRTISSTPLGFSKLALISKAFFNAILTPLPEGIIGKFLSIFFIKPVQLLVAPIFLATALIKDLLHYAAAAIFMATASAATAIKMTTLIILNAPLLTLDFAKASISHTLSFFRNLRLNSLFGRVNPEERALLSSADRMQQGLGESLSASHSHRDPQAPVHHSSGMFSSLYRRLVPSSRPSPSAEVITSTGNSVTP